MELITFLISFLIFISRHGSNSSNQPIKSSSHRFTKRPLNSRRHRAHQKQAKLGYVEIIQHILDFTEYIQM